MRTVEQIQNMVGGRWNGMTIFKTGDTIPENTQNSQSDRFCEVIHLAAINSTLIDPSEFTCYGARYAFGCNDDSKESMTRKMMESRRFTKECSRMLLDRTPRLETIPKAIGFNCSDEPDILISQLQPEQVMRLIQLYNCKCGRLYNTEISGVISACGNTAIKAYKTGDMAFSFGCDDSRTYGGLSRDRLYAGLPYSLALQLTG